MRKVLIIAAMFLCAVFSAAAEANDTAQTGGEINSGGGAGTPAASKKTESGMTGFSFTHLNPLFFAASPKDLFAFDMSKITRPPRRKPAAAESGGENSWLVDALYWSAVLLSWIDWGYNPRKYENIRPEWDKRERQKRESAGW